LQWYSWRDGNVPIKTASFELQFPCSELDHWAQQWERRPTYKSDFEKEKGALAAGARLAAGQMSIEDFREICKWKSDRPGPSIRSNENEDVFEAVRLALDARTPRCAIAALDGLTGVGPRMASAILTAMVPDKYAMIDIRALHALGVSGSVDYMALYPQDLEKCLSLRTKSGMDLRSVDHALWTWSEAHP
jgi:hypothetical protein